MQYVYAFTYEWLYGTVNKENPKRMHYRTFFMFMPNPNRIRVYVVAWPNQPRPHTMQTSWLSINLVFLTEEVRFLLLTGE